VITALRRACLRRAGGAAEGALPRHRDARAQFILEDFLRRARWFTGGVAGRITEPLTLFGFAFDREEATSTSSCSS
jgi:branched-chain amino acid transport system permease protein